MRLAAGGAPVAVKHSAVNRSTWIQISLFIYQMTIKIFSNDNSFMDYGFRGNIF
jgi:hypothetical protein